MIIWLLDRVQNVFETWIVFMAARFILHLLGYDIRIERKSSENHRKRGR